MAISLADFLLDFPEFATTDPDRVDFIQRKLEQAARRINFNYLGGRADDAHGFLTAHLIASSPSSSGASGTGQVASVHAGSVTVTYATAPAQLGSLESTGYGNEYLALVKLAGPGMRAL